MRGVTLFVIMFNLAGVAFAQTDGTSLEQSLEAIEDQVIAWRRDLHASPELSNREFKTAEKMAAHLRSLGLDEVETGIAHTGVVGTLVGSQPGPVIALRADMDGLPVQERTGLPFASKAMGVYNGVEVPVMHACGHDAHMAMLMGAASVLAEHRDSLRGTVKFIFQPAEEGAPTGEDGGAQLMVREGVLDGPDAPEAIFGLHVWPLEHGAVHYRSGSLMAAADSFTISIKGEQTHGSSPWLGVDPIHVATQMVTAIQGIPSRHVDVTRGPAVITIGSIQGGVRGNIIPDTVEMAGTIRTFDAGEREKLLARMKSTVENIAEANGADAEFTVTFSVPVTGNDPALLKAMLPSLEASVDKIQETRVITGAEDYSFFEERIPGLFMLLGISDPGVAPGAAPSNHSPYFNVNEATLIQGVRAHVAFAMNYAQQTDQ